MDIVSRLKIFLQQNGIGISQFADTCEIPRPTLSQLLNGRNKKVSDELISKIHRAYPALNIMWLLFGDGDMIVPKANYSPIGDSAQPDENVGSLQKAESGTRATINFGAGDNYAASKQEKRRVEPASMQEAMQSMARVTSRKITNQPSHDAGQGHVVSIMVFYSDGRFETFVPQ